MKNIAFTKIELKNYRQFKSQELELSFKKNKPFNIILGRNGFGKSNIFNAITWCFYGEEKHLRKSKSEDMLPLINKSIARNLKKGEIEEVKVVIWLSTEDGPIKITRSLNFRGVDEGLPISDEQTNFSIMITDSRDNWIESSGPNIVINRILPKEVMDFFFLDGEKLRQQFEDIDEKEVKNSILDISQINLLEKAISRINNIGSDIRENTRTDDPELEGLENKIKFDQQQIEAIPNELKKLEYDKKEAKEKKRILEQELRESSSKEIKSLQLDRDKIQENLSKENEELDVLMEEYHSYLIDSSHTILASKAIINTLNIIEKLKKRGLIPTKIKQPFLEELLEKKECICGSDISTGKKREKLIKLLKEMSLFSVADESIDLKYALKSKINYVKNFKDKTNKYVNKIENLEKEIKLNKTKLDDIRIKLKKYEGISENIEDKEKEIERYEYAIENSIGKIANLNRDTVIIQRRLNDNKKEYNRLIEKDKKNREIAKKLEFLDKSEQSLLNIKNKLLMEIRKEIESDVQKNFTKNLITEKNIKEIKINEDYKISVITEEGFNTLKSLSAGETLCLALSFMAAFRNISGFAAPIIIDTPLAKIDEEYRDNVLKFLANSLKNTQITLLVMSSEYTDKVKKLIKDSINEECIIKFDKSSGISKIIKK